VPLVYLAAVLGLQPTDHLGGPDHFPWLGRLVYDDYDPAARALRGLNAALGRTAGRLDEPPWLGPEEFRKALDSPAQAPQPTYFLEYPHAALLLFRLGYCFGNRPDPRDVPTAVSDGDFHDLTEHVPRNEGEVVLWRQLRRAIQVYAVIATLCLLALMLVLARGYEPGTGLAGPLFLLVLPATLYFTLHRFDVGPALLTALSLACLGRRRLVLAALLLAAATLIKVYPVLLAPLFVRYLSADRRRMILWSSTYAAALGVFFASSVQLTGWDATWAPYRFQLSRELEGWTLYGNVLPPYLGKNNLPGRLFRTGGMLLFVLALCRSRPHDLTGLLRRGLMVLIVFVCLQVFYSPQWILWFMPFLVPLAALDHRVCWSAIALDIVTFLSFPVVFDWPNAPEGIQPALAGICIFTRIAILAILTGVLWRSEFRAPA
jgi:hypothetical protein